MILCLGCLSGLLAQNIWKPIGMEGAFLGVSADGSIFSNWGYSGLHRSQDEGTTWEPNYELSYVSSKHFTINDHNRIFIFNENSHKLCYSDDNGDTWQEQASGISTNWVEGMHSLSNDTIVMVNNEKFFWTLDGGDSWNETNIGFLHDMVFTCILADHAGNVYISITNAVPIYELGIYTANFNDIDNWTWLLEGAYINHMELDPEGNVVAGGYGQYQQQPGIYLVPDWRFTVADNGIVYDLHNVGDDGYDYAVLRYSADHGETFNEYGEALPLYSPVPGGLGDGAIIKGRDGHLYYSGHGEYKKSVFNTNDINYIEGEVVISATVPCLTQPYPEWLAIRTADNREYCVMVDGFRPNPTNMDELIVRYDTIPVGSVIGAFGTIKEMEYDLDNEMEYDLDNGTTSSFTVMDVQQTTAHRYDAITAMLDPMGDKVKFQLPNPPYTTYYITINGEKQDWPLVFNGVTYDDTDLHTFIGHCEVMLDPYANQFNGMELQDIQPFRNYTFQMEGGTLSTIWDPLCLTLPCEDQHFLFVRWGDFIIPTPDYLMHNGRLFKDTYINNDVFREDMFVAVKGIQHVRYDIYGDEVNTVELVEMDAEEETTMTGTVDWAPMPYTSYIPVPSLELAFVANGKTYYLDNPTDGGEWFLVGNDTVYAGQEITATFTTKLLIDNGLDFYYRIHINQVESANEFFPLGTEWYYEIKHLNGDVTYQHLEYTADTTINSRRTKILVETNTMYDKDVATHEYIYEDGNRIYWWNKDLQEFTLLYDFGADVGDEWVINVGLGEITVHVDAVQNVSYNGATYRMLNVSDPDDFFSGDILCGIGHLKSFFPQDVVPVGKDYEVDGLRCFWQDGELILTLGEEDCDAVYYEIHVVDENDAMPFMVYPNPAADHLFVIPNTVKPSSSYRITNLFGQTLMTGTLINPSIDVSSLSNGIYFLKIDQSTIRFVVNQ